jgi:hypothetical protein
MHQHKLSADVDNAKSSGISRASARSSVENTMNTPPLLRKMNETQVGDLVVYGGTIIEPLTGCVVGRGFPDKRAAMAAAKEMNEVADWFGILKTRAEGNRPNCQDELQRIAEVHGGKLGDGAKHQDGTEALCAAAVARVEGAH